MCTRIPILYKCNIVVIIIICICSLEAPSSAGRNNSSVYIREVYDTRKWEWDIVIFMNIIYFIDAEYMCDLNNASIVWKTWKNGSRCLSFIPQLALKYC